ncbi:hypothetical protein [Methylobacterium durans]|uniref:Uncharacterized protein n=1 Tax=Methylobacterium durans TaxID=2202825 RepID=A0A2U8WAG5_9HYPH|nr:hypothetical protein [Methylobacterium durans]AWN42302.1 hypothetical protein DK389_19660 [Methylobacterium durans]
MLYGLYFMACLVAGPVHCEQRVHIFDESVTTPMGCLVVAQPQMADWQSRHPGWRVDRWRCGKPPTDDGARI